jgi:hypothetical protein
LICLVSFMYTYSCMRLNTIHSEFILTATGPADSTINHGESWVYRFISDVRTSKLVKLVCKKYFSVKTRSNNGNFHLFHIFFRVYYHFPPVAHVSSAGQMSTVQSLWGSFVPVESQDCQRGGVPRWQDFLVICFFFLIRRIPRTLNRALLAESSLYPYYGVNCLATAFPCYSNGIFGIQLGMH